MDCMSSKQTQGEEKEEKSFPPLSPISELLTTSIIPLAIVAVFEFENSIKDDQIIHYLCYKFVPFNVRLSSIVHTDKKGVRRWKKIDVRVEDHVIVPTFPSNLSSIEYDEVFQEYLSKLATARFREDQPMWEFHLIKYPTRNGSTAMVFRVSHSLGDGYSFMNLVFSTFERADDPLIPITFPTSSLKYNGRRRNYVGFISRCINTIGDIGTSALKPTVLKDHRSVIRSGTPRVEFEPITVSSITISLERIKQIKSKVEGSVNDVITGLIYYVIHLYTRKMGQVCSGKRMTAMVMFNARNLKGYKTIDEMLKANIWGNHASFYPMPIPCFTNVEKVEPLDFITKAKKNGKRMKNSMLMYLTYPILNSIKSIKGLKGMGEYVHSCLKSTSIVISNMIGPNEKAAMIGHPINNFYFIVTGTPQSLTFNTVSYNGEIKLVATMEKKFIDSNLFVSCMHEAFENMYEAICRPDSK